MKQLNRFKYFLILSVIALSACQHPEATPPTPMKTLPELERPVMQVEKQNSQSKEILIPRTALVERGGITAVFEVRNQAARIRMVRTGRFTRSKVEIISGLSGGETILRDNLGDVFDGSPIKPVSSK